MPVPKSDKSRRKPTELELKRAAAAAELDDDEEIEVKEESAAAKRGRVDERTRHCPYLDTINRSILDFDFEKLCSVTLSHLNVYACLVCGKYFQGRGPKSFAYEHSVQEFHHVFLNLGTQRFYCLPDNYEVIDRALNDIIYLLDPKFDKSLIRSFDTTAKWARAYNGILYLPGIVGLNNIKANDYCNAVLHALSCITPLRDYFLQPESYDSILAKRPPGDQMYFIVQRYGELMRKLWNPRNFKSHVSPHEMLQAVVLCSKKRFQITKQGDACEFLSWFLNALHTTLGGGKRLNSSIVSKTFRGRMRVYTRKIPPTNLSEVNKVALMKTPEYSEKMEEVPFFYLTCDLPPVPLYPDEMKESIIPQVPLATIMAKFNGVSEKEYKTHNENFSKRFELLHLPPYLIVYIKRFNKTFWVFEKNNTIVNFPIKDVEFGELLSEESPQKKENFTYDLVANIIHDGEPAKGAYRSFVLHKGSGKWFEMQDLHVRDILPQMLTLSESYIQIYELRRGGPTSGEAPPPPPAGAAEVPPPPPPS